jgi:hypothetical protein
MLAAHTTHTAIFTIIITNFIVSKREIYIDSFRSANAQMVMPGIEPTTFQLLGRHPDPT